MSKNFWWCLVPPFILEPPSKDSGYGPDLIACSMKVWMGKAWDIWYGDVR